MDNCFVTCLRLFTNNLVDKKQLFLKKKISTGVSTLTYKSTSTEQGVCVFSLKCEMAENRITYMKTSLQWLWEIRMREYWQEKVICRCAKLLSMINICSSRYDYVMYAWCFSCCLTKGDKSKSGWRHTWRSKSFLNSFT